MYWVNVLGGIAWRDRGALVLRQPYTQLHVASERPGASCAGLHLPRSEAICNVQYDACCAHLNSTDQRESSDSLAPSLCDNALSIHKWLETYLGSTHLGNKLCHLAWQGVYKLALVSNLLYIVGLEA